jgi:hypothetical protein
VTFAYKNIEIIVHPGNSGWILEKIALRIAEEFAKKNLVVEVKNEPQFNSDITFWIQFSDKTLNPKLVKEKNSVWSALVTHIDDAETLMRFKSLNSVGIDLVFMSQAHASHISNIVEFTNTPFAIRVGSDVATKNAKYHVGIVSKCFSDGRKNEKWLIHFAESGLLKDVSISIVGAGWQNVVKALREKDIEVHLYDELSSPGLSYTEILKIQKAFDLFFYFGFDEGSLGALDAYLLGTDLLVSNQGFHTEFRINEKSLFSDLSDAKIKFELKKTEFFRGKAEKGDWSWENSATQLLNHWESLLPGDASMFSHTSNIDFKFRYSISLIKFLPKTLFRFIKIKVPGKIRYELIKFMNRF